MPARLPLLLVATIAILLAACDGDDGVGPTATAPEPTATTGAAGTGVPEIDAALATLFSGDRAAVEALIQYAPTECEAEPVGLGAPPQCPEGVAAGTAIDVLPWAQCEGTYIFPEKIEPTVDLLTQPGAVLYGVYSVEAGFPPGDHVAMYLKTGATVRPDGAYAVFLTGGRVTGLHAGCNMTPSEFIDFFDLTEVYLAPAPVPPSGRTGVVIVDAILDYVEAGDAEALDRLVEFRGIPCIATPEGIGAPPLCRPGEEPGATVAVFSLQTCEFEYRREEELGSLLDYVGGGRLHGVYESGAGNYWIVYEVDGPSGPGGAALLVEGRMITSLDTTCGDGVEGIFSRAGLGESIVQP